MSTLSQQLVEKILRARVYDLAKETPLDYARNLSRRLDNKVFLKREDLQPVFSFKCRGAYNRLFQLSDEEKARGVVAASAGNHAQGVALAGNKLGIDTKIVMPVVAPAIKIQAVEAFGGTAVIAGQNFDEASKHALELEQQENRIFVHPFDDLDVIAGQGTVGMEIARQHQSPMDAIFVSVGGGGLISGVAAFIKYLYPKTKIIGVEHEEAASMGQSLDKGERVNLEQVGTFADGAAVKQCGKNTFAIATELVDEMLAVSTDETCAAIKDVFEDTRTLLEPAGALAVAGLKQYVRNNGIKEQQLIAISSGANVNFDRLRHVAERAEIGEGREALLAVTIPEVPGSFRSFCEILGQRHVTEFNYRHSDANHAEIFVGLSLDNKQNDRDALLALLNEQNYAVVDMSENEVAKLHLRHMVGGRGGSLANERLFRFIFPERPGALLHFLESMNAGWNISLFHYRNHGSDFGRVLVGIQVPDTDSETFDVFLQKLGYDHAEETGNPGYQRFLR